MDPYLEELPKRLAMSQGTHHPQGGVDEWLGLLAVENRKDVAGQYLGLSQGMLGQIRVRFAIGGWDGRTIAERPDLRVAWATHGPIDHDVPAFILLHGQSGHDRVGDNPGRQDYGLRLNRFFRQVDLSRGEGPHYGLGPDVG